MIRRPTSKGEDHRAPLGIGKVTPRASVAGAWIESSMAQSRPAMEHLVVTLVKKSMMAMVAQARWRWHNGVGTMAWARCDGGMVELSCVR